MVFLGTRNVPIALCVRDLLEMHIAHNDVFARFDDRLYMPRKHYITVSVVIITKSFGPHESMRDNGYLYA